MNKSNLLYDVANAQSKEQDERRRHFDTMATGILALSSALVGMLIFSIGDWVGWSVFPVAIILLGFAGVATTTIVSLWLREWHFQPPLSDLYKHMESGKYEDEALVIWSGKQIMRAIDNNEKPLRSKALWLRMAYICLAVEVVASGIFVFSVRGLTFSSLLLSWLFKFNFRSRIRRQLRNRLRLTRFICHNTRIIPQSYNLLQQNSGAGSLRGTKSQKKEGKFEGAKPLS